MTLGLLEMYHKIKEKLRPTPTQAHYVFNLHDVARVVHGILLMSPRSRTRKMMRRKKGDNESSNFHWKKKKYWHFFMFCYWHGFCGITSMIYELMLYFLVIPTLFRMRFKCVCIGGNKIHENWKVANRNHSLWNIVRIYSKSTSKCLISLLSPGLCYL